MLPVSQAHSLLLPGMGKRRRTSSQVHAESPSRPASPFIWPACRHQRCGPEKTRPPSCCTAPVSISTTQTAGRRKCLSLCLCAPALLGRRARRQLTSQIAVCQPKQQDAGPRPSGPKKTRHRPSGLCVHILVVLLPLGENGAMLPLSALRFSHPGPFLMGVLLLL